MKLSIVLSICILCMKSGCQGNKKSRENSKPSLNWIKWCLESHKITLISIFTLGLDDPNTCDMNHLMTSWWQTRNRDDPLIYWVQWITKTLLSMSLQTENGYKRLLRMWLVTWVSFPLGSTPSSTPPRALAVSCLPQDDCKSRCCHCPARCQSGADGKGCCLKSFWTLLHYTFLSFIVLRCQPGLAAWLLRRSCHGSDLCLSGILFQPGDHTFWTTNQWRAKLVAWYVISVQTYNNHPTKVMLWFTVSVPIMAVMAGTLLSGILADRIGRKATLVLNAVVLLIGWAVFFMAPTFTILLVSRVVSGTASGIMVTTSYMLLSEIALVLFNHR